MRPRIRNSRRGAQRGAALFISLIALIFMLLGGLALIRSVDTGNLIAGNFSFKQASLQATDVGLESAFTLLNNTIAGISTEATYPAGCVTAAPTACQYFPTRQAEDAVGVPTAIGDWSAVPSTTMANGYTYQFVIERLCTGTPPIADIQAQCMAGAPAGGGSKKSPATVFTGITEVFYRATVRVTGPRNTQTVVQTLFAR
jgi:Tfp pilus assembly protein PilX